jgi:hypothetical protein
MPNNSSAFALSQEENNMYCKQPLRPCVLPPGAKPLCFANAGTTNPNGDQFCGYIQNGFLYSAKGCCTPACPNADCPSVAPRPPTGTVPIDIELSPELVKEQSSKQTIVQQESGMLPLPKLVKLMLLILAILVVSALLLSI